MNYDINEIRITGTVTLKSLIPTTTGRKMTMFFVHCWKQNIQVIAFDTLAEKAVHLSGRVEVKGYAQAKNYTDKHGMKHEGWQIVAKEIGPETAARQTGQANPVAPEPGGDPPALPAPLKALPLVTDHQGRPPILNDRYSPF